MCGIIGYVGTNNTTDILLDSLELLEYRGYDSAGIAFNSGQNISVYKCPGRVSQLREMVGKQCSTCGIGHTRWATHGSVSYKNAHPHTNGMVTLVHNGIIENYKELISEYKLQDEMVSSGDSEVAAILLNRFYDGRNPFQAIQMITEIIEGTYAFVIMFADRKDEIYAVRQVSPIIFTHTEDECILASDLMPLSRFSDKYSVLPERAVLRMSKNTGITVKDFDGNLIDPVYDTMNWKVEQLDLIGYSTYMEKEISQQPDVIYRTFASRIREGLPDFESDGIDDGFLAGIKEVNIVACGTSYHAGLIGKYLIEKYAGIRTNVYLASEFIYSTVLMDEKSVLLAISQSGETIDTLEAMKTARKRGIPSLAIVNVKGSSIALTANYCLFTNAGPEIAVASTKAYTCQLTVLYLLTVKLGLCNRKLSKENAAALIKQLQKVPAACNEVIKKKKEYEELCNNLAGAESLFMIGRGLDYYTLLEGSLKLKEISYIHSEAYASGELKHGPIALIDRSVPVIAAVTQGHLLHKESSNIKEVRARNARAFVLIKEEYAGQLIQKVPMYLLPDLDDDFMTFPCVIALQWIAYYSACQRGLNVDKPRNLAKVVTVE